MVVLDASVVLKWFRNEPGSDKALSYLINHKDGIESVICPFLLHYELFNALVTKDGATMQQIVAVLEILKQLKVALVLPEEEETRFASIIALEKGVSFYDAAYVALAHMLKINLITADKTLVDKIKLPFVKLLD